MESHTVIKDLLKEIPAKQLAGELGVSLSLVYKWAESQLSGAGASNPLDRVELLARLSNNDAPLHWLCARRGGMFVKKNQNADDTPPPDLRPDASRITREISRLLVLLGESLAADALPSASATQLNTLWTKLRPLIDAFVLAALQGDYHARANAASSEPNNNHPITNNTSPNFHKYKRRFACLTGNNPK